MSPMTGKLITVKTNNYTYASIQSENKTNLQWFDLKEIPTNFIIRHIFLLDFNAAVMKTIQLHTKKTLRKWKPEISLNANQLR